jgi:hypothetical protein
MKGDTPAAAAAGAPHAGQNRKCRLGSIAPAILSRRRYRFFLEPDEPDERDDLRDDDFRDVFLREDELERLRDGTFAPFLRASFNPMAMACLRPLTLRPEPLFSVPFFRRRIADSIRFDAALPYFGMTPPVRHELQRTC